MSHKSGGIILPETIGRQTRLRDALADASPRGRDIETAFALALQKVIVRNSLSAADAIRGMMGSIVNIIQARAPSYGEAKEVGEEVCEAIRARLGNH